MNTHNLQGLIFDLDGTLLDTLEDIAAACNHALQNLGQPPHPAAKYKHMVGDGADVLVQRALPGNQQGLAAEVLRLFKEHYTAHAAVHTRLYPGITECLDAAVARGIPLAILTNKPQAATDLLVQHYLSKWHWVAALGHRANEPKKPDPFAALQIAQRMAQPAAHIGFVGDSNTDMQTACNAGMVALGAAWGFRGREELVRHGAQHVLEKPCDLLRFV